MEFRRWLQVFNEGLMANPDPQRRPLASTEVVEVAMEATNLDPVKEVSEVQRIINEHNLLYKAGKLDKRAQPLQIKSVVFNTGYLLKTSDTKKLIERHQDSCRCYSHCHGFCTSSHSEPGWWHR